MHYFRLLAITADQLVWCRICRSSQVRSIVTVSLSGDEFDENGEFSYIT